VSGKQAEILPLLWSIQRLDSELDTIKAKIAEIPRKIEGMLLAASDEKKQLEETHKNVADLKKRNKLIELDVKEIDEKIGARSTQLYATKTNELYKAFLKEIESLNAQKNKLEEEIISVMEGLEEAERKVRTLEKEAVAIEQETQERVRTLEQEKIELESALAARQAERANLAAQMDPGTMKLYERIRTSKKGIAVVSVAGQRCNGCLIPTPPQLMLEVAKQDRLHFCEHCGRILVPPEIAQYDKT
jgi:predicted  nucleic acid-binding Zn-ribbon protein